MEGWRDRQYVEGRLVDEWGVGAATDPSPSLSHGPSRSSERGAPSFWEAHTPFAMATSLVAQTVKRLPAMQETWVQSLGWEDPLEKEMATHCQSTSRALPVLLPGNSHGWRSLVGYSPWCCKELDMTERLLFLKKDPDSTPLTKNEKTGKY